VDASPDVPKGLRTWFVIHFAVDIVFAVPLLLVPKWILPLFGWSAVDPITSRLVGAALLGIGGASLLERNAGREVFRAMLGLKIIWATAALVAIALGILAGGPATAWLFFAIFGVFLAVWIRYRRVLV
jgi:cation transport ATPase